MSYRARLWKTIDRRKAAYRSKMKPVFLAALKKHVEPLYEVIPRYSDITQLEVPRLDMQPIIDAYKRLYMATAFDFAVFDRRQAKSMKDVAILKSEEEIFESIIQEQILSYLETNAGSTVTAVGDTSIQVIQSLLKQITPEIIEQGIGGGAAQTMLRDMIESAWHRAAYYRTERIVRTDVNRAANWGSLEGVKSTDLPHYKVWLASFSAQSRQEHMDADSQKVDINDAFSVGPDMLEYPGDPAGQAGNTINCLCSMTYEIKQ